MGPTLAIRGIDTAETEPFTVPMKRGSHAGGAPVILDQSNPAARWQDPKKLDATIDQVQLPCITQMAAVSLYTSVTATFPHRW